MRDARSLTGKPIRVCEDFITANERMALLNFARSPQAEWNRQLPHHDVWYDRLMNPNVMPEGIQIIMLHLRHRAMWEIKKQYEIEDRVYADTLQLVRWPPGTSQGPHADAEEPDGTPNAFPWRAFASIIYLNDDFEGGQIHFPELGLEPRVKPGMLAFFPATADYLHGVRPIMKGVRYTASSFYTFDPARHDGLPI